MTHRLWPAGLIPLAAVVAACAMPNEMPVASDGARVFAANCVACHGADARGGVGPDLTAITARNDGTFPRARVLSVIDGYSRGTHAGRVMPEFGATMSGDLVPVDIDGTLTPTPRDLVALLFYLESIQG